MDLIYTPISIIGLAILSFIYLTNSRNTFLGGASLPCMMVLTSLIYFYIMPFLALIIGGGLNVGWFGMFIDDLTTTYVAVTLYAIGAAVSCMAGHKVLAINPTQYRVSDTRTNEIALLALLAFCILMMFFSVLTGRLNLFSSANYQFAETSSNLRFINLFFTSLVGLTTVYAIRDRFRFKSIVFILFITGIFLQVGFRYRLILLVFSLFVSFMLINNKRISTPLIALGCFFGLLMVNLMRGVRRYGNGLDLSRISGWDTQTAFTTFGGEIGPIYVTNYTTSNTLPELIHFEPWAVAIARLVPTAIWPNKPSPDYLNYFHAGFFQSRANEAGIAAPQHVEMLLQFGWIGLPILASLYFGIVIFILSKINKLPRDARIAGFALVPIFFGFYMQTRGYFFQTLSDGLFLFGPLFLLKSRILIASARPGSGQYGIHLKSARR